MHDLGSYSRFLGVNYLINIAGAGEDVAPDDKELSIHLAPSNWL
jgi:hypothetical protein